MAGAWSSIVGRPAVTEGRYRSNGGGAAGPDSGVTRGPVTSTPPGAWSFAMTVPATSTTVSSGSPGSGLASRTGRLERTTCARPERSLTIRNVTAFSSRRRCSQPAILTCSPRCAGRSAARTREIIALLQGCARRPLGSAGEKGTRGATALSPPPGSRDGLVPARSRGQAGGAWGTPLACGSRSSPRSGGSSRRVARPPSQRAAALSARVIPGYLSPSALCQPG